MKIRITDIPEEGTTVNADASKDSWLKAVMAEVFGKNELEKNDGARLNLQMFRSDRNVTIVGGVILQFHPICDRCLTEFKKQEQVTIHQVLLPASIEKKGLREDVNVDDEDVTFYKGEEIDLGDVVKENVILDQQMVNICSDDCKGLCQKCGANLNLKPCKCKGPKKLKDSPFSAIKGLKIKKKKRA